jgi:hypothetical protein
MAESVSTEGDKTDADKTDADKPAEEAKPADPRAASAPPLRCGLVMPISAIDGCNEQHWLEVKRILAKAIKVAGFHAELVSIADDSGVIHKRIIDNLYHNSIVVCDLSGNNSNVMLELGMRLAFDKPAVLVKDDKTTFSFDPGPIEHLLYPRDLRHPKIVKFISTLAAKVRATYQKATSDPDYSTFLKTFGTFTTPTIETKEVPKADFIIEELAEVRHDLREFMQWTFSQASGGSKAKGEKAIIANAVESFMMNLPPAKENTDYRMLTKELNDNVAAELEKHGVRLPSIRQKRYINEYLSKWRPDDI